MKKTIYDVITTSSAKEITNMHKEVNNAIRHSLSELFPAFVLSVEKCCAHYLQDKGLPTSNWQFGDVANTDGAVLLGLCPLDEDKNIIDVKQAFNNLATKCDAYVDKNLGGANEFAKLVNDEIKKLISLRALLDDDGYTMEVIRRAAVLSESSLNYEGVDITAESLASVVAERIKTIELAKASKQAKAKAFKASLASAL